MSQLESGAPPPPPPTGITARSPRSSHRRARGGCAGPTAGWMLVIVGLLFFLGNLGWLEWLDWSLVWPAILIVAGILMIVRRTGG